MGIDKGNSNAAVMEFDSIYGVQYPSASGQQGGGNAVHFQYDILGTPTIVVITPDKLIANQQISPPNTMNVVTAVTAAGGMQQSCLTSIDLLGSDQIFFIGPNPVQNMARISIYLNEPKNIEIELFNLTGQRVLHIRPSFYNTGSNLVEANMAALSEDLYMVVLKEKGRIISKQKLILSK